MPASLRSRILALHRLGLPVALHRLGLPVAPHRSRNYCGRNPTKGSCRPRRRGRRSGDHQPQQQFRCRRSCGRSGDLLPLQHLAAGSTVAGAPPRGAAGFEEGGGGPETANPSSRFAARDRGGGQETYSHCSTCPAGSTVAGTPPRGAAGHEEGGGGPETANPSSRFAARDRGGGQETYSHCSTCPAGSTVAGTPPRGAAGHEEGGGGPETANPSSRFAARDRGGGQETYSHCSTCPAGSTVAGTPPRGAAGHEEGGGGPETANPSSRFAARDRGGGQETYSHCSTCPAGSTVAGAPQKGAASYEEGGRSGDHPQAAFPLPGLPWLKESVWELSARLLTSWPVATWLLATLPSMNPLKSLFLAQDFERDFWDFKGGGGH
ncbi:UNVERIFIED_CONTAM: hypothetical protein FKN15_025144 [Acipenser sinensis]